MSADILAAIDQAVAEHESCPCGRELPADCPSFYWCGEACQIAWNLHQYDPGGHPHPRDIRARQDQIRADGAASRAVQAEGPASPAPARPSLPARPAEQFTPVSGLNGWSLADTEMAAVCAYERWCSRCEAKRPPVTGADRDACADPAAYGLLDSRPLVQECPECRTRWPGRPLVGVVEQYHGPGPSFRDLFRLRLTDGFRSATRLIPRRNLELWRSPAACLALEWEHLEEMLCDGVTDRQRQQSHVRNRFSRHTPWDWFPVVNQPNNIVRPGGIT